MLLPVAPAIHSASLKTPTTPTAATATAPTAPLAIATMLQMRPADPEVALLRLLDVFQASDLFQSVETAWQVAWMPLLLHVSATYTAPRRAHE
eukprot:CAMPEP_0206144438 /NCGR_PEP_ID=MMETSP1473-20131121/24091_1 /ASSEMBLY_ACC=CAM_ASM_001109 /TAXON_ID=1461547 /ORGANISM="Stichococcus sp, Strain RCC1054" /LENGTH=92 /DNA_ID=CAMNT_0053540257 /DNA_START=275 /DNA_END=551 /DNA_ORIENTATION=+